MKTRGHKASIGLMGLFGLALVVVLIADALQTPDAKRFQTVKEEPAPKPEPQKPEPRMEMAKTVALPPPPAPEPKAQAPEVPKPAPVAQPAPEPKPVPAPVAEIKPLKPAPKPEAKPAPVVEPLKASASKPVEAKPELKVKPLKPHPVERKTEPVVVATHALKPQPVAPAPEPVAVIKPMHPTPKPVVKSEPEAKPEIKVIEPVRPKVEVSHSPAAWKPTPIKPSVQPKPAPTPKPVAKPAPKPAEQPQEKETVKVSFNTASTEVQEGRALLRILEHGSGPGISIRWPQGRSARDGLYKMLNACYGMKTILMDSQGNLYHAEGARGHKWEANMDRYSGFVRSPEGYVAADERRIGDAISRYHGMGGMKLVRLFPRSVDAALLGGLKTILGQGYTQARSIQADYRRQGAQLYVDNIRVDGRSIGGRIAFPIISRSRCT